MSKRLPLAEIERQVNETQTRALWTIPASWWEPETAERMSDWIKRFVPEEYRADFIYGRTA